MMRRLALWGCFGLAVVAAFVPADAVYAQNEGFDPLAGFDRPFQAFDRLGTAIRKDLDAKVAAAQPPQAQPQAQGQPGNAQDQAPQPETQQEPTTAQSMNWVWLRQFYDKRLFRPLWLADGQPTEIAKALVNRLLTAPDSGLPVIDLRPQLEQVSSSKPSDQQRAAFELAMTEGIVQYARSLSVGRYVPAMVDSGWYIPARTFNSEEFLKNLVTSQNANQLINSLEPTNEEYQQLKQLLRHYRELAAKGGWPKVPESAPVLKPGMKAPLVPMLRRRLMAQQEFSSTEPMDSTRYDPSLIQAVKTFQRHHGLKEDGVIGNSTLEILNISVEERIQSILASLERWRWLPRDLGSRYVMVNLPSFILRIYDQGQITWQTRIIDGEKKHPSPSISADILQVKVNPDWYVPNKIAVKEMIPELQKNPDYLRDNGYTLLMRGSRAEVNPRSVDWRAPFTAGSFPYLIKQDSGDANALGRLKLVMPNRHAIYLHDTPTKHLFEKDMRAFSHGCIRVQSPEDLAGQLLDKNNPEEAKRRVMGEISQGETKDLDLPEKVPVYLTYFTTRVESNGEVRFLQDIYGRDKMFDQN